MEHITVLVLTDSSLQVVIAYQVENHYDKACMNYGLKCALHYTLLPLIFKFQALIGYSSRQVKPPLSINFQTF